MYQGRPPVEFTLFSLPEHLKLYLNYNAKSVGILEDGECYSKMSSYVLKKKRKYKGISTVALPHCGEYTLLKTVESIE